MASRSVLITGGTGGLGIAVTAAFIQAGWRVVVPARNRTASMADGVVPVIADLTEPEAAARAVATAASEPAAPLRAVVNLVGGFAADGLIHETPITEFERMFTLNLRPTYLVTHYALPHLVAAGEGTVVCVSSKAALAPFAGAAGYIAAKSAVLAFSAALAVEYRQMGIRSNAVIPGIIDTPANRAAQPGADHTRWTPPEQIAGIIRFLAGAESAPMNGATVPVHG